MKDQYAQEWPYSAAETLDRQILQKRLEALKNWAKNSLDLLHWTAGETASVRRKGLKQFEQAPQLPQLAILSASMIAA